MVACAFVFCVFRHSRTCWRLPSVLITLFSCVAFPITGPPLCNTGLPPRAFGPTRAPCFSALRSLTPAPKLSCHHVQRLRPRRFFLRALRVVFGVITKLDSHGGTPMSDLPIRFPPDEAFSQFLRLADLGLSLSIPPRPMEMMLNPL